MPDFQYPAISTAHSPYCQELTRNTMRSELPGVFTAGSSAEILEGIMEANVPPPTVSTSDQITILRSVESMFEFILILHN